MQCGKLGIMPPVNVTRTLFFPRVCLVCKDGYYMVGSYCVKHQEDGDGITEADARTECEAEGDMLYPDPSESQIVSPPFV